MRLMRPLVGTRLGLAVFGVLGTSALAALGAAMFAFPAALRPVVPILINGIAARLGQGSPYRSEDFHVWAWAFLAFALLWGALFLVAFIRRPAEDRRIDAALRDRLEQTVRGAPTEPV